MLAHNVIIISSGLVGATSGDDLTRLLETIRKLKKKAILVLGPDGDDLLRQCQVDDECEIVFDPNFEGGFFSSLKAGLFATHGAAFVTSLQTPTPEPRVWHALEAALFNSSQKSEHVMRPILGHPTPGNAHTEVIFPLLVTAQGVGHLKGLPADTPWPPQHEVIFRDVVMDESEPFASTYP